LGSCERGTTDAAAPRPQDLDSDEKTRPIRCVDEARPRRGNRHGRYGPLFAPQAAFIALLAAKQPTRPASLTAAAKTSISIFGAVVAALNVRSLSINSGSIITLPETTFGISRNARVPSPSYHNFRLQACGRDQFCGVDDRLCRYGAPEEFRHKARDGFAMKGRWQNSTATVTGFSSGQKGVSFSFAIYSPPVWL